MYHATNIFADDPDAQQAFDDALPIVAELLEASARIPPNSQAGRSARELGRHNELKREHEGYLADIRQRIALKAERIGIPAEQLIRVGTETLKAHAHLQGRGEPAQATPLAPHQDARSRELNDAVTAAETALTAARRAVTRTRSTLAEQLAAERAAKDHADRAWAELRAHERSLAA